MIKFFISIIIIIICSISCAPRQSKIDHEILVVPASFKGPIVIFYNQNTDFGKIEFKNGIHYFFVDTIGVFFTTKKLGQGLTDSKISVSGESNFVSPMSLENSEDDKFVVSGGDYKGFKSAIFQDSSEFIRYSVFMAGKAKSLKNGGWFVNDSLIESLYGKYIK